MSAAQVWPPSAEEPNDRSRMEEIMIKISLIGDANIGKTSLMVKYVENKFDDDYIQTLGINYMEKRVRLRNSNITFSVWDLGGQREFVNMLPLVCNEASAVVFMFDLSRRATLNSVKEWYRQVRVLNRAAVPILVGTKLDIFRQMSTAEKVEVTAQARRYAHNIRGPLIYCSSIQGQNVAAIFKIILAKCFNLKCNIPLVHDLDVGLLEY